MSNAAALRKQEALAEVVMTAIEAQGIRKDSCKRSTRGSALYFRTGVSMNCPALEAARGQKVPFSMRVRVQVNWQRGVVLVRTTPARDPPAGPHGTGADERLSLLGDVEAANRSVSVGGFHLDEDENKLVYRSCLAWSDRSWSFGPGSAEAADMEEAVGRYLREHLRVSSRILAVLHLDRSLLSRALEQAGSELETGWASRLDWTEAVTSRAAASAAVAPASGGNTE